MRPRRWRQRAARPQPPAHFADHLGALAVVADEGDVAAALAPRLRLGDVVQDRAEAQRGAAGQLVGERLFEQRPGLGGALAGEALEVALDLERSSSTARVWPWTSRWWFGLCSTPRSASSSGSTTRSGRARPGAPGRAAVVPADQPAELGELPLAGRLGGARGFVAGRRSVPASISSSSSAASRAARSRRSGSSAKLRSPTTRSSRPPGRPGRRKGRAAAAGERHRDRADREVAPAGRPRCLPAERRRRRPASRRRGRRRARSRTRSESSKACPPAARAIAFAAASRAPATARSRSATGRPSAASRTAPPTIQVAAAPRPARRARAPPRRRREPLSGSPPPLTRRPGGPAPRSRRSPRS